MVVILRICYMIMFCAYVTISISAYIDMNNLFLCHAPQVIVASKPKSINGNPENE